MATNPTYETPPMPGGFNVYGYLTGNLGLGVAARNTAEVLLARGLPTRLCDVNPGGGMQGANTQLAADIEATAGLPAKSVNLFHINPDQVLYLLDPRRDIVTIPGRLQVSIPFWELPRLPDSWLAPLEAMDVILAPTRFVEGTIRASLPDAEILHYPQTVHLPDGVEPDRAAFGLPQAATVFATSFDMRSDIERKNPWGAIEAFGLAFPTDPDVRLVIKANNVTTVPGLERYLDRLRAAATDPRIVVIDRPMTYREIVSLYASADVVVSLHRAEGLGLSLLEGMALGKAVVATGWSGNMDFMTPENSIPVAYDMIDVKASTQPAYGKGMSGAQQWAEPRVSEAAQALRRLAESPELRTSLGERARADAEEIRSRYDRGEVFDRLLAMSGSPDKQRRMEALSRAYYWHMGRRIARAGWRRAKTAVGL